MNGLTSKAITSSVVQVIAGILILWLSYSFFFGKASKDYFEIKNAEKQIEVEILPPEEVSSNDKKKDDD